jgi:hypothetical protein
LNRHSFFFIRTGKNERGAKRSKEKRRRKKKKEYVSFLVLLFFDVLFQKNFITTNYTFTLLTKNGKKNRSECVSFISMQQTQIQNFHNPRLSTSSHSSLSAATTALLNGLLPSHRFSQASANTPPTLASNLTPTQLKALQKSNNKLKRLKRIKNASIIISLTLTLSILLIITIEFSTKLVKNQPTIHLTNLTLTNNLTNEKQYPIRAFFTCVWIFNGLLFINYLIIHSILFQRRSRRTRTKIVFFRYHFLIFLIEHPL